MKNKKVFYFVPLFLIGALASCSGGGQTSSPTSSSMSSGSTSEQSSSSSRPAPEIIVHDTRVDAFTAVYGEINKDGSMNLIYDFSKNKEKYGKISKNTCKNLIFDESDNLFIKTFTGDKNE